MTDWLILSGLLLITVMASLASTGWDVFEMRNRETWWWTGILMVETALMPNLYMAAVLALVVLGLFQIGRSWFILRSFVIPVVGVAGAYIVTVPHVQPWMVPPVLWVGVVLGGWAALDLWITVRPCFLRNRRCNLKEYAAGQAYSSLLSSNQSGVGVACCANGQNSKPGFE